MLTLPVDLEFERDSRASYRPFSAQVQNIVDLSPSFRRVTFTSPDFLYFATHGLDQRIKLVFPLPGARASDLGEDDEASVLEGSWYQKWRELADDRRSPMRTYTVRDIRPRARELDVDFVRHPDGGPAARWLEGSSVGDGIIVVGPDARSADSAAGINWHPGIATELLLIGDGSAAPAICSILESLPDGVYARAFIEVPSVGDRFAVTSRATIEVTWLTAGLHDAVRSYVHNDLFQRRAHEAAGNFYAWLAGESAVITRIRRFLIGERGVDRSRVAFMGYWRRGTAEVHD